MKTAQENIDLQTTILSRFDLIFIVKDERSMERDKRIAQHVIQVHRDAGSAPEADEDDKKVADNQLAEQCKLVIHKAIASPCRNCAWVACHTISLDGLQTLPMH